MDALQHDTLNKQFLLNTEYKNAGQEFVSLTIPDTKDDVAQSLLSDGLVLIDARRERRLAKLVATYQKAQDKAKQARVSVRKVVKCSFCSHDILSSVDINLIASKSRSFKCFLIQPLHFEIAGNFNFIRKL